MDSGSISALVAIAGMFLSALGITGVDSSVLNSAANGVISIVAIGAALWSWYSHRTKSAALSQAQ